MKLSDNRQTIICIVLLPLLHSCATILNQPVQKIFITTDKNVRVVSVQRAIVIDSSLLGFPSTTAYFVRRNNRPLVVTAQVDTAIKQIVLRPRNSVAFWLNIIENYGIGMLADKNNVRRYSYPSRNYFSAKDTGIKISRFPPVEKGTIRFSFSLPFMINHFDIKTPEGQYSSGGVYGAKSSTGIFL